MNVCNSCRRHVRESLCPFCGGQARSRELSGGGAKVRGAAIVASAVLAASLSATPAVHANPMNVLPDQAAVAAYGVPMPEPTPAPVAPPPQQTQPPRTRTPSNPPPNHTPPPVRHRSRTHRTVPGQHAQPTPPPPAHNPAPVAAYGVPPPTRP